MNSLLADKNRRVLVIDDNRSIHDDFRKILCPTGATNAILDATEVELFGPSGDVGTETRFEVSSAYQGQEGFLLVRKAVEAGLPYAVAFVDVRMPPGWDGVETTRKIWEVDPDIQVVLCTAYSDYSWEEMFEKLGHSDGLLILKKPFDAVEAFQMAHALTEKWGLHRKTRNQLEHLESLVRERTKVLEDTNASLTQALANVQTLSGLIPICAGCKHIRDDKGFWTQVESYVSAHSEARFSHSLCPDCAKRLYPDFAADSSHDRHHSH